MQNTPLVSIITPMFNSEKYVEQTIDSVLQQEYQNWQLIIVDDGSIDDSYSLVKNKMQMDSRIQLFRRERLPKGVSTSRNIGIEKANGEYLMFLDSDDLLYPHCLQQRMKYLSTHPHLDFAVFQMEMLLPTGAVKSENTTLNVENYLYSFLSYRHPWTVTSPFWKSSFFKKHLKGFDESFHILEDPELHTRALMLEDINFDVLYQKEYVDCTYRVDYKPINIKKKLIAALNYSQLFIDRIKGRSDENKCRQTLVAYYETLLAHYSGQENIVIFDNISTMQRINKLFMHESIIERKMYTKTRCFLLLHKYKLFENKLVKSILKKMGFTNFYYFIIQ